MLRLKFNQVKEWNHLVNKPLRDALSYAEKTAGNAHIQNVIRDMKVTILMEFDPDETDTMKVDFVLDYNRWRIRSDKKDKTSFFQIECQSISGQLVSAITFIQETS